MPRLRAAGTTKVFGMAFAWVLLAVTCGDSTMACWPRPTHKRPWRIGSTSRGEPEFEHDSQQGQPEQRCEPGKLEGDCQRQPNHKEKKESAESHRSRSILLGSDFNAFPPRRWAKAGPPGVSVKLHSLARPLRGNLAWLLPMESLVACPHW